MKKLKNSCNIGETGEVAFMLAVISRGFIVSQPFGHASPYDCVVDVGGTLIKVQVKTAKWRKIGKKTMLSFSLNNRGRTIRNTTAKFDVLVGYDLTNKDFYIVPSKNVTTTSLCFSSKTKPYIFKNNWSLLTSLSTKS